MVVGDVHSLVSQLLRLGQPVLNHKVIKIPLRVQSILTKQVTRRKQICDFVNQTSSDLNHAGSIYDHASVLDVGRLIGQAGHLEQLQA